MALRWIEGFENTTHTDYFTRLYASSPSGLVTGVGGRKHGLASSGTGGTWQTPDLGAEQATWVVQFALRKDTSSDLSGDGFKVGLSNSSGEQVSVVQINSGDSDGNFKFEIRRGATVLATTVAFQWSANPQGWHVFQFKALINTTTGTYDLKHWDFKGNATVVATGTGANTSNQGSGTADRVTFGHNSAGVTQRVDDVVILDGSGASNNDLTTNPFVVHGSLPNGNGNQTDWNPSSGSNHADLLDDVGSSPGGTDNVYSSTVNDIDLLTMADFGTIAPNSIPTIAGMQVNIEGNMENSGSRTLRARVRSGVSEANGTTDMAFSNTSKDTQYEIFEQNPVTAVAWTRANLVADELGFEMTA